MSKKVSQEQLRKLMGSKLKKKPTKEPFIYIMQRLYNFSKFDFKYNVDLYTWVVNISKMQR